VPRTPAPIDLRAADLCGSDDNGTAALPVIRSEVFRASGGLGSENIE